MTEMPQWKKNGYKVKYHTIADLTNEVGTCFGFKCKVFHEGAVKSQNLPTVPMVFAQGKPLVVKVFDNSQQWFSTWNVNLLETAV